MILGRPATNLDRRNRRTWLNQQRVLLTFALPVLLWCWALPPKAQASTQSETAAICTAAAHFASGKTGVPVKVLQTISLTETGRRREGNFLPWPWTVNMEGKGVWFENQLEALEYVNENFQRGARSFDVGCFQLNYKWHGQAFASIEEMFEPKANALYAASFLRELFQEKGNWADAAGAYHSRTPKYAQRYIRRFSELYASVADTPAIPPPLDVPDTATPPTLVTVRINRFPLLQNGGTSHASLGSLMPASAGQGGTSLFGGG